MKQPSPSRPSERPRLSRDQLITVDDLDKFKQELLLNIRYLLSEHSGSFSSTKSWMKTEEVQGILRCSRGTLHTLRANGTLPYVKMGGSILYSAEAIEKVLQGRMDSHRR